MLSGYLNLFGLAFLLCSLAVFLWRERVRQTYSDCPSKELFRETLLYIGIFVFFMGNALWLDNGWWFRGNLIVAHIVMIRALYLICKMWWMLLFKEMPKWWGALSIGLSTLFLITETYYAFKGYLPYTEVITNNITVLIRNDHPIVALLFIPVVGTSFWPMAYVFFYQSVLASGFKLKLRLFVFGLAWFIGSSMTIYTNFVDDPNKVFRGNVLLITVFIALIFAILFKPKPKTKIPDMLTRRPTKAAPAQA